MSQQVHPILSRWRLFLAVACVALAGGAKAFTLIFSSQGYAPEQPIPFSHKLHAGQYKINCLYCHTSAEKSRFAGVPPMDTCMGCHAIAGQTKPNIQKLTEIYKRGENVQWVRVHALPDHAYFSHRWHVAAGVACQTCHGPVETMDKVAQNQNLGMGWCISCHRNDDYLHNAKNEERWAGLKPVEGGDTAPAAASKAEGWKGEKQGEYNLGPALPAGVPFEKGRTIADLGSNWLTGQTGPGAIDHVKDFQNASIQCSNCHQ